MTDTSSDHLEGIIGQCRWFLSHEVSGPSRHVRQYAAMLQEDYADTLGERGLRFLSQLEASADRLDMLIAAQTEYMDAALPPGPAEAIALQTLAQQALHEARELHEGTCELEVEDRGPLVLPADTLGRILFHLLDNSLRSAQTEALRILVRAERGPSGQTLLVKDDGPGLDTTLLDRVRLPSITLRRGAQRRAGMGLAICDRLVQGLGGEMTLESAPNAGFSTTLRVPAP